MASEIGPTETVDFHFDIMCPYAYQTSIWLREVRSAIGVKIRWRFFSLEEINRAEGKKGIWYAAAGSALHERGLKPHRREVAEQLLSDLGFDPAIVGEALADQTTSDEVLADHERVTSLGGWGVPTMIFEDDTALFGPVLIDPPTGDAAVRLWDLVRGWREFPHVFELQRPKQRDDIAAIATAFEPYLNARDWVTIQHETP